MALAALLFMAVTQLSQAIVTRGLALLGMRTDAPAIVQIVDGCGHRIETAPANARGRERWNSIRLCDGDGNSEVDIIATASGGLPVSLLLNGTVKDSVSPTAALVRFNKVRLRGGRNILAVGSGPTAMAALQSSGVGTRSRDTSYGRLPIIETGAPLELIVPEGELKPRIVGAWKTEAGQTLLIQGPPNRSIRVPAVGGYAHTGDDGFALISGPVPPLRLKDLSETQFKRIATFSRQNDGNVRATVQACLPKDSALAQWAAQGTVSAREFITRLTAISAQYWHGDTPAFGDRISLSETPDCRIVRAETVFMGSALWRSWGTFTLGPHDTLTLKGFGQRLDFSREAAEAGADDSFTFRSGAATDGEPISIKPNYPALIAEVRHSPPEGTGEKIQRSRIAAAWARVLSSFPNWVRALLSGIASVAPLIILILAVRNLGEEGAAEQRRDTLAGLYALLLLALAAAAQPLLFELFYRAANFIDIWGFLFESRADQRPSFFDPYTPIAIVTALMLVPLLRSAGARSTGNRGWAKFALSLFLSAAGVAVLIALLLLQISPWAAGSSHADSSASSSIQVLDVLADLGPSRAWTVPIIAAAIAAGILFAWIAVHWAFRTIMPGGRFLGASLFAAAAAVILPVCAYLIEALRILLATPSERFAESEVSWTSLFGAALLPFLLFLILLRAFREILATVAPAELKPAILRWARTPILIGAALILALPRMALDSVNPSTDDMGIIEVLRIFQSFGLAAAAFAVAALLWIYGRNRTTENQLQPFQFGNDEILLLSAMFAAYLSLWASEPLALAAAMGAGWFSFRKLVLDKDSGLPPELADAQSAADLIALRRESALLASRRKTLEDRFVKAEDDYDSFDRKRVHLARIEAEKQAALGVQPSEVKRRLLEFGPGPTPLANGLRGALAGLLFATILQLVSSIRGPELEGQLKGWADLARSALADPTYAIASIHYRSADAAVAGGRQFVSPDLLLFLGTLLNAYFLWIVLGFIFGFAFHRIRGDDGFIKALACGAGVAVVFFLSGLFSISPAGVQPIRLVPVMLFLLIVGVAVFDARSLATRGQSPSRLAQVYGFGTSLGYVSMIGAIATLKPIFDLIKGLFGK